VAIDRRSVLAAGLAALVARVVKADEESMAAPDAALRLFDGGLDAWLARKGGPARWLVGDGFVEVVPGAGDIVTREHFGDFQLHVEFRVPLMNDAKGQARGNSGVYLQGRYEIQVLDSYGKDPENNDCGAIYKIAPPLRNACRKPEQWQTYDVAFRAARGRSGQITERARVTVFQNGLLIHDNFELPHSTHGALDADVAAAGPLLLQDHGTLVRYRNVWLLPGPAEHR
jgi:hypothetical protein